MLLLFLEMATIQPNSYPLRSRKIQEQQGDPSAAAPWMGLYAPGVEKGLPEAVKEFPCRRDRPSGLRL